MLSSLEPSCMSSLDMYGYVKMIYQAQGLAFDTRERWYLSGTKVRSLPHPCFSCRTPRGWQDSCGSSPDMECAECGLSATPQPSIHKITLVTKGARKPLFCRRDMLWTQPSLVCCSANVAELQKTSPAPKQFSDLAPSMLGSDLQGCSRSAESGKSPRLWGSNQRLASKHFKVGQFWFTTIHRMHCYLAAVLFESIGHPNSQPYV